MARQSLIDEQARSTEMKSTLPPIVNGNASYHLELRQHLQTIKTKLVSDKFSKNPSKAVLEINSRDGRRTAGDLRKTINPLKLSAKAEAEVRNTAQGLISAEGSAPSPDVDTNIFGQAETRGTPDLKDELDKVRQTHADFTGGGFNDDPKENQRLIKGVDGILGEGAATMVKNCIPCGIRNISLDDVEFSNPFANTLEDLAAKLDNLKKLLHSLELENGFEQDICDLLRLLDAQCIPDLFGILSLFGIMQAKYFTGLDNVWKNALNTLIAPFLQPVIGPFTHNLERYTDMIADPLTCVLEALETQMYKVDAVGAIDNNTAQKKAFNRKKIEFYDRKVAALKGRQRTIVAEVEQMAQDGSLSNNTELELTPLQEVDTTRPVTANIRTFPRYKSTQPFTGKEIDLQRNKADPVKYKFDGGGNRGDALPTFGARQSYQEEIEEIAGDIRSAEKARRLLNDENKDLNSLESNSYNDYYQGAQGGLNVAKAEVQKRKQQVKSILRQITTGLNQGLQVIRDTLEMYRLELERLITGRVQNQEDQIELARNMQQMLRYIALINALIKLKEQEQTMNEICNGGSSTDAMGAFVGAFKEEPTGGDFTFYAATDSNGNELMVVAPGGATVNVTSVNFEDVGEDQEFGDVLIDDIQSTATFNDLNEADELNRKGVLLDLGDIDGKEITIKLDDAGSEKTDLDLRAESSYVIIKNDFCSKSPIRGSSDTVRQWAENL